MTDTYRSHPSKHLTVAGADPLPPLFKASSSSTVVKRPDDQLRKMFVDPEGLVRNAPVRTRPKPDLRDMPQETGIVALIPAYNEELVIGTVVLEALQYADRVVVVDDGSADRTAEVAELAGAHVIGLEENRGKAHALMTGAKYLKQHRCRAVVMLDGDGQHNPAEIPAVAAPVLEGKADLVIGSRYLQEHGEIPAYRMVGQKTLDIFNNFGSDFKTTDSQSGFRALSCEALRNMNFSSEGYNIEIDMMNHFADIGLRITEVPISVRYDVPTKHKKNAMSHGLSVLGNIVGVIGTKRPLLFFGVPGIILLAGGVGFGFMAFDVYYEAGQLPFGPTILSAFGVILGLLLMTSGLILNSLVMLVRKSGA